MKQYFEILELQPGATTDEVKKAYRDLAKVWHPDRFKEESPRLKAKAIEKLAEINEAYEKIREYQARQKARKEEGQQRAAASGQSGYNSTYAPPSSGNGESYSGYARPTAGRTQTPHSRSSSSYSQPNVHRRSSSSTRSSSQRNGQSSEYDTRRSYSGSESAFRNAHNPNYGLSRSYHSAMRYGPYGRSYSYAHQKRRRRKNPVAVYLAVVAVLAVTVAGAYVYIKKSESRVQQPTLADYPLTATPSPYSDAQNAEESLQAYETNGQESSLTSESSPPQRYTSARPSAPPPAPGMFTLGSSKREVVQAQGEPEQVRAGLFRYGFSTIFFDSDRVIGWQQAPDTPLKVQLRANGQYDLQFFTLGSTRDEVLSVQGTPDHYRDMGREFRYGESRVTFEAGRVVSWHQHPNHPLRVKLLPRFPSQAEFFTYNSTRDEVLSVQGTPDHFNENTFHYGYSTVRFENDRVVEWNRTPSHPLKVKLEPSVPTSAKFFTHGSTRDEVIAAQGTPDQYNEHMFKFGYSTVSFDNGRVVSWYQSAASPLNVHSETGL